MESNKIKDFQISSHTFSSGWLPEHGRLNYNNGAWCSANNDKTSEYFEIDLLRVRHVSAIATQGVQNWNYLSYYVKTYVIKYSYDGRAWLTYKDTGDGPDKVCNPQCVLGEVSFTFTIVCVQCWENAILFWYFFSHSLETQMPTVWNWTTWEIHLWRGTSGYTRRIINMICVFELKYMAAVIKLVGSLDRYTLKS